MNVSTRQLKAFVSAARHCSFSRAAEEVFITQSGLSVLIRELEAQLGFRLFDRTTRQVALTAHGNRFLAAAVPYLEGLEAVVADITQASTEAASRILVGAPPLTCAHFLPGAVVQFRKEQPAYRVRLFDHDLTTIAAMVKAGDLDVGLGMYMKPLPEVAAMPLVSLPLDAVWPADARVGKRRTTVRWADVGYEVLIGLPPDNPLQQLISKTLQTVRRRRPPDIVVNYFDTQIALAEAGEGVAIVPGWARRACRNRNVIVTRLVDPLVDVKLYQIYARGRKAGAGVTRFMQFLTRYAGTWESHYQVQAR
jgi:DNA-binding transcriptional LysR family regulator